ncbi:MAG: helicase-related protein [Candidatus Hodarchaeales archaeon]
MSPYRLGLTATLNEGEDVEEFSGPVVIKLLPSELRKTGIITDYSIKTIEVELDQADRKRYDELLNTYRSYIRRHKLYRKGNPIQQMVLRSGRDEQARKALRAFRESRKIYQNASRKIEELVKIFETHPDEQILIFSESVPFIEKVSRELLLPLITHKTNNAFRKKILQAFKKGNFRILASGRIFDEGLDMRNLSVGVIVSGTSQQRQLVQRLGRVLRKSEKKDKAFLYEIITKGTVEERHSAKRKRGI